MLGVRESSLFIIVPGLAAAPVCAQTAPVVTVATFDREPARSSPNPSR
jgi:hypothetical protein